MLNRSKVRADFVRRLVRRSNQTVSLTYRADPRYRVYRRVDPYTYTPAGAVCCVGIRHSSEQRTRSISLARLDT